MRVGPWLAMGTSLGVSWALVLGAVTVLTFGPGVLAGPLLASIRSLRRAPMVVVLVAYVMLEGWYSLRGLIQPRASYISPQSNALLTGVALLNLAMLSVVLFAGRTVREARDTAANLGLLALGLAVSFVAFAWAYAYVVVGDPFVQRTSFYRSLETDPQLGLRLKPGPATYSWYFAEEHRWASFNADADGMRNTADVSTAPVAGIGDSLLFGLWAADDQLWSAALSHDLGVPVANYSFVGYNLLSYNLLAQRYASHGQHPLVIYGIYANDLPDFGDEQLDPSDTVLAQYLLWYWRSPINFTLADFFISRSPTREVSRLLNQRSAYGPRGALTYSKPHGLPSFCEPGMDADLYSPDEMNVILESRITRAAYLARAGGYRVLFVLIPSKESVYREELNPLCGSSTAQSVGLEQIGYSALCQMADRHGQACYDMTPDFRAAARADQQPFYYGIDGHWTPHGHAEFAGLLARYIRDHHLLPPDVR